jgi:hypothetical protein
MKGNRACVSRSRFRMLFEKLPWRWRTTHPNFHRRQSCYIGLKSPSLCISMVRPRTVTGAQGCFVDCVIFTRAKTARGTIARRSVSEKEKNEPRGMPSPALAFMENCSRKGVMAARGGRKRNSLAPVSEADTQLERLLAQRTNCASSALRSSQVAFLPLNASDARVRASR